MKKLLRIVLLIGIVLLLQNCSNNYKKAQSYAEAGNYQAFYNEISRDVKNGNNQAKNLLIDYFFKAIQDGNEKAVQYYLEEKPSLVDMEDSDGNRAVDVVLFDEQINIPMLKILLQYHPDLNYIVKFYDMSPLQVIVSGKYNNIKAIKLLLHHGADVNFIGTSNRSKNTPLILSYVRDKIEVFSILLKAGANYTMSHNNLYDTIASSYGFYLKNHGIDLKGFYNKSISSKTQAVLHTFGYRTVHEKNMKYLTLLQRHINQTKKTSCAAKKLIKWYIKTRENKALQSLMSHNICKKVLDDMKEFAIQSNNRAALYILNQKKGRE